MPPLKQASSRCSKMHTRSCSKFTRHPRPLFATFLMFINFKSQKCHRALWPNSGRAWRPASVGIPISLSLPFIAASAFRKSYFERCPGPPNPNFEAAMAAEHCSFGGCDHEFTTGTHKVTTTPRKEWMYIVGDENGQRLECPDMWHGRCIVSIDEYMQRPRVVRAGLNRTEVIALVMESGPMVCSSVLCFFFCATCVCSLLSACFGSFVRI